jgi:hypothetical protein
MPLTASYINIANQAWALIEDIKNQNAAGPLPTFLGPAGMAVIGRHFPANWLNGISIASVATVPVPAMADMVQRMGYANEAAFHTACDTTDPHLWPVLQMFSHGQNFAGITYGDRIYVAAGHENELDLVLHELVHTLQWSSFMPVTYLRSYIRGFVGSHPAYQNNPAEVQAYGYQYEFRNRAAGVHVNLDANVGAAIRGAQHANGNPGANAAVTQLNQIQVLGITAASAAQGMV